MIDRRSAAIICRSMDLLISLVEARIPAAWHRVWGSQRRCSPRDPRVSSTRAAARSRHTGVTAQRLHHRAHPALGLHSGWPRVECERSGARAAWSWPASEPRSRAGAAPGAEPELEPEPTIVLSLAGCGRARWRPLRLRHRPGSTAPRYDSLLRSTSRRSRPEFPPAAPGAENEPRVSPLRNPPVA